MVFMMTDLNRSCAGRGRLLPVVLLVGASACAGRPEPAPATERPATGPSKAEGDPAPAQQSSADVARPKVVCLGDSLTAGYGLPPDESFPARLQKKLDEAGYVYEVVNAGVSGD